MPALVVAIAVNPASSIIRALATSQTLASSNSFEAECMARKASAFFGCSRLATGGTAALRGVVVFRFFVISASWSFRLFPETCRVNNSPAHRTATDLALIVAGDHPQGVKAPVEGFEHGFGFDVCPDTAGGAMLDVDCGSDRDLVLVAVGLQGQKRGDLH